MCSNKGRRRYDSCTVDCYLVQVSRVDPVKHIFEFVGNMNSYILEHKIAPMMAIPPSKKRQIYSMISRRARILEKLAASGVDDFYEFFKVISKAQREGIF